jgi:ketosteroid isomerase-like protein
MADITVSEVDEALTRFVAAYNAKDADAAMALIGRDPDTVMVGTGADEIQIGPAEIGAHIEQELSQADKIDLKMGPTRVSVHGDVAWAFAEPTVVVSVAGEQMRMSIRMTLVLVKTGDELLIHNGHLSVAYTAQKPGQPFADA